MDPFEFEPSAASYGAAPNPPTVAELRAKIARTKKAIKARPKDRRALLARLSKLVRQLMAAKKGKKLRAKAKAGAYPVGDRLARRIAKVKARISTEKAEIVKTKAEIATATGAAIVGGLLTLGVGALVGGGVAAALGVRLHKLEKQLHRDRHLLSQLHKAAVSSSPAKMAVVEAAAAAVEAGKDPAVVPGYAPPVTAPPAPKSAEVASAEAIAEANDPSGATTAQNLDAVAGEASPAGEAPTTDAEAAAVAEAAPAAASAVLVEAGEGDDGDDDHHQAKKPGGGGRPLLWIALLGALGAGGYAYAQSQER